jgi:hypothetical protein
MEKQCSAKRPVEEVELQTRSVRSKLVSRKRNVELVNHQSPRELIDKFKDFLLFKAFDIISEGSYRRFVLKQKHSGDQWAIDLYACSQEVVASLKSILKQIHRMQYTPSTLKLYKLCQRIVQDLNPPTISSEVWKICALTGMRTDKIVCIGKSSKGDVCFVHQKFHGFFCKLWFLARIEVCIKQFTQLWCQVRADKNLKPTDYKGLCSQLKNDHEFVNKLCQYFITSIQHVQKSLTQHIEQCSTKTLLKTE